MARLSWPRLAIAGAVTIVLLVVRVIVGRPLAVRPHVPVNFLGETPGEETRRRLAACEANLQNIWEALNARDSDDR